MLTSDDWVQMKNDLAAVRGDAPVSIVIRRDGTSLAAQEVRIARQGAGGATARSQAGQEARGKVVVMGGTSFDVRPGDRFNADGLLYEVVFVRPNREAAVMAEAELVE